MSGRRTGAGGTVTKRCDCGREVLRVHRGAVEPAAPAVIEAVLKNGTVVARCVCRRQVTWLKAKPSQMVTVATG